MVSQPGQGSITPGSVH